jgi:hypothetical protein
MDIEMEGSRAPLHLSEEEHQAYDVLSLSQMVMV